MGVLSFWGDESGSHGDGPFVLAGYLGLDDSWTALQDEWHHVLQHDGRSIEHFHTPGLCAEDDGALVNLRRNLFGLPCRTSAPRIF
jgi:hypothetical protein